MKKIISPLFIALLTIVTPVLAQQAGDNINVLPVYSDPFDPEAYLKGDGYLQRQVEPTIAASTRNPDHLLAFFNDYRAVDVANDTGLGEAEQIALLIKASRVMLAAFPSIQLPEISVPPTASAFEAWVGMSRSYDGGITWSGGFMPGAPFDPTTVGLQTPVYGLDAATDPVVVAGPCGTFYVVFVAFTRGGESQMVVARYEDLNNEEGGDTIVYQGMTVLESGNNATNGYFLDKPHINLDVWRGGGAPDECAHRVYVSYSTFNGNDSNGNFRSKINFAKSEDGGLTFDVTKIQQPYNRNQGSFVAIDPREGTPKSTGGGTVYLVWRHFDEPDAVLMSKTEDYGKKWSKIVELTGDTPMAPFDQPTVPTSAVNDPGLISFRSNGFPTAAVTADGTLFAAWQERVNISVPETDPAFGKPDQLGSPRIVLTRSEDGGETWSDREAADFTSRQEPFDPVLLAELGELPGEPPPPEPVRPSGPQVMPKLSFGGGRLMLAYYESRGLIGTDVGSGDEVVQPADVNPISKFISGYDRVLDLRAALLDPATGNVVSTSQVSRYPISLGADLTDGQDLADVAPVNAPCSPDFGDGLAPCVRQVNRANAPQSGAGTSPFIGDYIDLVPTVQFVNDGGVWRWAIGAEDVPFQGFHAIFVDNRHLVPPTFPEGTIEWLRYPNYGPPGIGGSCFNAGSRNTDVLTSKVASLIVSAPTTYKQLDARRGFPLTVRNPTDTTRYYRIEIVEGNSYATFSVDPDQPFPEGDVDAGEVEIFAYSSISQMVYIDAQAPGQVKVKISELTGPNGPILSGGQTGTVILNADPTQPAVQDLDQVEDPTPTIGDAFVINPVPDNAFVINEGEENAFVINPFVDNAFVINDSEENAFVINAFVINAFVINAFVINQSIYDVVDTTWTVTASGADTSSSYLPLINIDNAEQFLGNYAFQLIVDKTTSYGTFAGDDAACAAYAMSQQQVVSNVTQDPTDVENAFVINPAPANAFVINAFPENAFVINSTFTMAPSDAPTLTKAAPVDDGTLKAPRAKDVVKVTLRAYQLVPDSALPVDPGTGKPFKYNPDRSNGGDEPAFSLVATSCTTPECLISNSPDLVSSAVGATPVEIEAGASFDSPAWTLSNQGSSDAIAEVRNLRHGFFLSRDRTVELDTFSDEPVGGDRRIGWVPSSSNTVPANDSVSIAAGTGGNLTVPSDVAPGDYYLVLFVDDYREVSEKDEPNNQTAFAITILEPNDPPVASDMSPDAIDEDTTLEGVLEASDPDLDDLTFTVVSGPSQGDLTLDTATGAFTYTPDLDTSGTDSFTFTVSDGEETSNEATVSITINATNDTPQVGDVSLTVNEDGTAEGVLEVFDPDNDINSLTYEVASPPSNGEVAFPDPNNANAFTYTPDADFNGNDQFTVTVSDDSSTSDGATVTITITSVNDKPVADDAEFSTDEDNDFVGTVTASDVDLDSLIYTVVSGPSNGSLSAEALPSFTYSPNADFNGSDSFTFKVNDGEFDSAVATINITVNPANDAPTSTGLNLTTDEDQAVVFALTGDDIDNDPLTFTVQTEPSNGVLSGTAPNLTYIPNANFNGSDTFTYVADDGTVASASATVSITVNPVNDAPTANDGAVTTEEDSSIAVTLTGSDIDGDALTFAIVAGPTAGALGGTAPNLTYTPNADSTASDSFTFVANDGTVNSEIATVTISVNAVNDPPVAGDDAITVLENSGVRIIEPAELLTGDTDIDGPALTVTGASGVDDASCSTAGTVSFDELTQITSYTPPPNFESADCFAYSISDGAGGTDVGLVTVIVDGQNPDWTFVGFAKPWRNNYRINAGSGFPLKWYYEDKLTGSVVDSSMAEPVIHIYGPLASCNDPIGTETPEVIEDTGSSDIRYSDGDWQFNWDTVGLGLGCYKIEVESRFTLQIDGPFTVILK